MADILPVVMRERDEARRDAHRLAMQRDAAFADLALAQQRNAELTARLEVAERLSAALSAAADEALKALDEGAGLLAGSILLKAMNT